ncbi:MAG: hypothetical protein D6798_17485 [Deltaproteobacteria bacterium]|nr:MAG: hypothetical protein D6798_17485 [Deltaproteobacteria bacterium]
MRATWRPTWDNSNKGVGWGRYRKVALQVACHSGLRDGVGGGEDAEGRVPMGVVVRATGLPAGARDRRPAPGPWGSRPGPMVPPARPMWNSRHKPGEHPGRGRTRPPGRRARRAWGARDGVRCVPPLLALLLHVVTVGPGGRDPLYEGCMMVSTQSERVGDIRVEARPIRVRPVWRRVPLWQGLLDGAPSVVVPAGAALIEAGVPARRLIVIEDGEAEVIVGEGDDALVTGDLLPGDHAGGRCLLGYGAPAMATVRARGACRVRVMDGSVEDLSRLSAHPGMCGLDALVLLALQAHVATALAELDAAGGRCHRPMERCFSEPMDAGLDPEVELLASTGRAERLPEGGVLFRPKGRGGRPDAFLVLSGLVRRLRRQPDGRMVELRPCRPGEVGGFEEALGFDAPAAELVAGPATAIIRVPAGRCLAALRSTDSESERLRRAMGRASAADLDDLRSTLTAAWPGLDPVVTSLELDQVLMLRATVNGFPGAI